MASIPKFRWIWRETGGEVVEILDVGERPIELMSTMIRWWEALGIERV